MRLASIQIMRGLAALLVTLYHVRALETLAIADSGLVLTTTGLPEPGLMSGLWGNGFIGVDLFFVISGFIMVYVTRDLAQGWRPVASFLFARASRIYPLWWLFASIMALYFLYAYGAPVDAAQAASSGQSNLEHLLKSYLLVPQSVFPVLGVGWTLVHEMYFYFVFAAALALPRRWLPYVLAVWGACVVAGSLGGLSGPFAIDYPALIFYPMTIEFVLGAFAGLLVASGRIWKPATLIIIGAVWLAAVMQLVPTPEGHGAEWTDFILQWGRVLIYGVPSALIIYAVAGLEVENRMRVLFPAFAAAFGFVLGAVLVGDGAARVWPVLAGLVGAVLFGGAITYFSREGGAWMKRSEDVLVTIGDWSYSIYLCHMLVLSALRRVLPSAANFGEARLGLPESAMDVLRLGSAGLWDNLLFLVVSVAVTLAVSWASYRFFERPLTRRLGMFRRRITA